MQRRFFLLAACLTLILAGCGGSGKADERDTGSSSMPTAETVQPTVIRIATSADTAADPSPTATTGPSPTATRLPSATATPEEPLLPVTTTIPVGSVPASMAWGAGAIWVGNGEDGTISRIDPATNTVVATIEMHANQWTLDQALNTCCPNLSLAGNDQQIWAGVHRGTPATITDTVEQIDPATNQVVRTIDLPSQPEFMLLDGDTLWITSGHSDQALRVDIPSGTVVATFEIKTAGAMAVADGAAWISGGFPDGSGGALYRIDPQTNTIAATIDLPLGGWPFALNDELWLVEYYGNGIHRIDMATNTIAESTHVSGVLGGFPGAGSIWVNMLKDANFPGIMARIDPDTMEITARYDAGGYAGWMLFAEDAVWITELQDGLVQRIDP